MRELCIKFEQGFEKESRRDRGMRTGSFGINFTSNEEVLIKDKYLDGITLKVQKYPLYSLRQDPPKL